MSSLFALVSVCALAAPPSYVEDQFEIPKGFRVYKAAGRDLCGASLDITFDGQGRLLVGDGKQVRRLTDNNGDNVYDGYEVIATGLGGRGPQGLLVYGDVLYAVGGDGIQRFDGYLSLQPGQKLKRTGRVGAPFRTGGDHDAHTILRGHDGFLYFITGDGGGARDRVHITAGSSPARVERAGSVFRFSPDGQFWECIGTGARNAPNLGMNYLGELFSLDSDMEWHVDLPWWRPVRLHHWLTGGDQGWQSVGAYPPYFIDCLPGIYDVGRGSPDWGVFYEHTQFPKQYKNAYFVCDYRSKSATTGGYTTNGRLFAFFLKRDEEAWTAEMEVFAKPKPGARDAAGRRIDFAVVDCAVAPDGSLFVSDHGQGVWRIIFDPSGAQTGTGFPSIASQPSPPNTKNPSVLTDYLLRLPQPSAEWSRVRSEQILETLGEGGIEALSQVAKNQSRSTAERLQAMRYLAKQFSKLPDDLLISLHRDPSPEVRGYLAWIFGLRLEDREVKALLRIANDNESYVRRRALEALTRNCPSAADLDKVVRHLEDPSRLVRYAAMMVFAKFPVEQWFDRVTTRLGIQTRLRALIAADLRGELREGAVRRLIFELLQRVSPVAIKENRLDMLRVLDRLRRFFEDASARRRIAEYVLTINPDGDPDLRWEQIRLLGRFRIARGFRFLLEALEAERPAAVDRNRFFVTQFHAAQALARFTDGWTADEEKRAVDWFLSTQKGWFAEHGGKGRQFPGFWATVLRDFCDHHADAVLASFAGIDMKSQLGKAALNVARSKKGADALVGLYKLQSATATATRTRILDAMEASEDPNVSEFLREEFDRVRDAPLKNTLLRALTRQPPFEKNRPYLEEGLAHRESELVRACALGLARFRPEISQDVCQLLITRMTERRDVLRAGERFLETLSDQRRPGANPRANPRRAAGDAEHRDSLKYWKEWYKSEFDEDFRPFSVELVAETSNADLRKFLLSKEAKGGNPSRGQKVYDALCLKCHGTTAAGQKQVALFGPDLQGITRRLQREELVDALVFPSKSVPERFKGTVVQRRDGIVVTGFITDQNDKEVTLVAKDRVHKITRKNVLLIAPQKESLMPGGLLNRLPLEDVRDLMALLDVLGNQQGKEVQKNQRVQR